METIYAQDLSTENLHRIVIESDGISFNGKIETDTNTKYFILNYGFVLHKSVLYFVYIADYSTLDNLCIEIYAVNLESKSMITFKPKVGMEMDVCSLHNIFWSDGENILFYDDGYKYVLDLTKAEITHCIYDGSDDEMRNSSESLCRLNDGSVVCFRRIYYRNQGVMFNFSIDETEIIFGLGENQYEYPIPIKHYDVDITIRGKELYIHHDTGETFYCFN